MRLVVIRWCDGPDWAPLSPAEAAARHAQARADAHAELRRLAAPIRQRLADQQRPDCLTSMQFARELAKVLTNFDTQVQGAHQRIDELFDQEAATIERDCVLTGGGQLQ